VPQSSIPPSGACEAVTSPARLRTVLRFVHAVGGEDERLRLVHRPVAGRRRTRGLTGSLVELSVEHLETIAASSLRRVHRGVGLLQQLVGIR
jgi:hypothetical protein